MFSLLLTLFVIPAIYTYVSGKHKKDKNKEYDEVIIKDQSTLESATPSKKSLV
jgi:hypothetical protein